MSWTRLDLALILPALLVALLVIGIRTWQHRDLDQNADKIASNIYLIAEQVQIFKRTTGKWFPQSGNLHRYPDPFSQEPGRYQGLALGVFDQQNNAGMILQLVQFQKESTVPKHLFAKPFKDGEPYLRVLLDYGAGSQIETEVLMRAQSRLPADTIAEIDDHFYIVDLRKLIDGV